MCSPFLSPPARREHEVEVVAHILVEVGHHVVVVPQVQVGQIIVVVVCIYVVVDV